MGMSISIIIGNMAPVSLRIIFQWPPIQNIPSSIVVPCTFFVRLERLHEAAHKFDRLSSQEDHFPR